MIRNIDFNIAAILLLLVLFAYFYGQYDISAKSSKIYLKLLAFILITAILNVICDLLVAVTSSNILLSVLFSAYLFFIVRCAYTIIEYTRVITIPDDKLRFFDILNQISLIIYSISCIANIVLHHYIYAENNTVIRGKYYIIVYLLSAYYLFFSFYRMIKNIKVLSRRQTHGVFSFVLITVSGAALQFFFFENQMIVYFIYAVACMIFLFEFETPDYQKLIKTTEELKINKENLEISKLREEDLTKKIHQLMKTSSWFIDFDKDGNIKEASWSDEIKTLLGYSQEDHIDVSSLWTESLHPDDKEAALAAFMKGLQGEEYRIETRLRYKDNSYHHFLCTGSLETDASGKPITYQGIIQNIDDEIYKREFINERLQMMEDLERSQADLHKALLATQEANRAKTTFLSNMSHDIRTPMNAIIGYTQLAKEHISDKDEVLDCLNTIKSSGNHLLSLINDVLDMSRIESGKVKVETSPSNLSEMIEDIRKLTKANIDEKNQTYESDTKGLSNSYVLCDRLRLNQILINCIGNSIKYTPDGGHINISVSERDTESDGVKEYIFKISDDGIGMSEEFVKHVFEPFERAKDTNTANIQGTGLGMAITQNLVQMMGGTISAESELGKGSTFTIVLPLTLISKDEYVSSREDTSDGVSMDEMLEVLKGRKFLVVDDNKINRTVLKRLLGDRGMHVDECDSGEKAVKIATSLEKDTYDLIFMDIMMPGMNGYETTDEIRHLDNEFAKKIPIVAMTANAFEEDKKEASLHAMNGHVTKPFKIDELISFLYNVF